jgi:hypothetical protein
LEFSKFDHIDFFVTSVSYLRDLCVKLFSYRKTNR